MSEYITLRGCFNWQNPVVRAGKVISLWCKDTDLPVTISIDGRTYDCVGGCPVHFSWSVAGRDVAVWDANCDSRVSYEFTLPCRLFDGKAMHQIAAWSEWSCINGCVDVTATITPPTQPSPTPTPPPPGAPGMPTEYMLLLFMMAAVLIVVLAVRK